MQTGRAIRRRRSDSGIVHLLAAARFGRVEACGRPPSRNQCLDPKLWVIVMLSGDLGGAHRVGRRHRRHTWVGAQASGGETSSRQLPVSVGLPSMSSLTAPGPRSRGHSESVACRRASTDEWQVRVCAGAARREFETGREQAPWRWQPPVTSGGGPPGWSCSWRCFSDSR
jgi:hypothetical protein